MIYLPKLTSMLNLHECHDRNVGDKLIKNFTKNCFGVWDNAFAFQYDELLHNYSEKESKFRLKKI